MLIQLVNALVRVGGKLARVFSSNSKKVTPLTTQGGGDITAAPAVPVGHGYERSTDDNCHQWHKLVNDERENHDQITTSGKAVHVQTHELGRGRKVTSASKGKLAWEKPQVFHESAGVVLVARMPVSYWKGSGQTVEDTIRLLRATRAPTSAVHLCSNRCSENKRNVLTNTCRNDWKGAKGNKLRNSDGWITGIGSVVPLLSNSVLRFCLTWDFFAKKNESM